MASAQQQVTAACTGIPLEQRKLCKQQAFLYSENLLVAQTFASVGPSFYLTADEDKTNLKAPAPAPIFEIKAY